jgi:hypothetical protein
MKRLFYISLALVLLGTMSCKRNKAERQYERYLNDSDRVEFVTPPADTVEIEEELEADKEPVDDEGIFSIPDIPEERRINMNSNAEEIEELMGGKDIEKEDTKAKKK